ncbi:MAG: hypothetical protein MUP73_04355 [Dehalococcoidia bacterium]|nr:hypothetical protein [Dehalococcoidia bacterium]
MPMLRERHKMTTIEAESIDVAFSGGLGRSSNEASVMGWNEGPGSSV